MTPSTTATLNTLATATVVIAVLVCHVTAQSRRCGGAPDSVLVILVLVVVQGAAVW